MQKSKIPAPPPDKFTTVEKHFILKLCLTSFIVLILISFIAVPVTAAGEVWAYKSDNSLAGEYDTVFGAYQNSDVTLAVLHGSTTETSAIEINAQRSFNITVEDGKNWYINKSASITKSIFVIDNDNAYVTLSGNGTGKLIIDGQDVVSTDLGTIQGSIRMYVYAGIVTIIKGNLELNSGVILQNSSSFIDNSSGHHFGIGAVGLLSGNITMNDGEIINNYAKGKHPTGGVFIYNGNFKMNGGIISNNTGEDIYLASSGNGGVLIETHGSFDFAGGEISNNNGIGDMSMGGIENSGILSMSGNAKIINNTAGIGGVGGIRNNNQFEMSGGEISNNTAEGDCTGGVYNDLYGNFEMSGGKISYNSAEDYGTGGVYNDGGVFEMSSGEISYNRAGYSGIGGVCNYGNFEMSGGEISYNTAEDHGVGGVKNIFSDNFEMSGGEISHNTAEDYGTGGVKNIFSDNFEMIGGEISHNTAEDYGTGGVYNGVGNFTMLGNSKIIYNNAGGGEGVGGVRTEYGTFDMLSGTISHNSAGYVGGAYNCYSYPHPRLSTFSMSGGEISNNTAFYVDGKGGVYNHKYMLMSDIAKITSDNIVYLADGTYIELENGVMSGNEYGAKSIVSENKTIGTLVVQGYSDIYPASLNNFQLSSTWSTANNRELELSGNNLVLKESAPILVPIPVSISNLIYNGLIQTADIPSDSKYTLTNNDGIAAGTYTATASLNDPSSKWSDGTNTDKSITWIIEPRVFDSNNVTITLSPNKFNYDGNTKTPSISVKFSGVELLNSDYIVSPEASKKGIDAGSYSLTFTGRNNFTTSGQIKVWEIISVVNPTASPAVRDNEHQGGYAEWYGYVTYEVFFDSTGGSYVEKISNIRYNDKITEPAKPYKYENIFDCWVTESGRVYDFENDVVTETFTLYAKWTDKSVPATPTKPEQTAEGPLGLVGLITGLGVAVAVLRRK